MSFLSKTREMFSRQKTNPVTTLLIRQTNVAIRAAELANEACTRGSKPKNFKPTLKSLRNESQDVGDEIVTTMATSLTVPLEREDVYRASQALTLVTNDLRDLVREMSMWDVKAGEWSKDALPPAIEALSEIKAGLRRTSYSDTERHFQAAHKASVSLRRTYQQGLSVLFAEELTMDTLKKREILRRVDLVGTHLSELSLALLDAMIKRFL